MRLPWNMGKVHRLRRGDPDQELTRCRENVAHFSKHPMAHLRLGALLHEAGQRQPAQLEEALGHYTEALRLLDADILRETPETHQHQRLRQMAHEFSGQVLAGLGQREEAREHLAEALDLQQAEEVGMRSRVHGVRRLRPDYWLWRWYQETRVNELKRELRQL